MAWTAPRTWSVSEVVTAAMMNAHVRDNLLYLKGAAGAYTVEGAPTVTVSDSVTSRAGNTNAELVVSNTNNTAGSHYSALRFKANDTGAGGNIFSVGRILGLFQNNVFPDAGMILQTVTGNDAYQDVITLRGVNVGIGSTAPAGKLHVLGGPVATAGFAFGSLAAVTSIQTMFAAGTVARAASIWYIDRNNTGGACVTGAAAAVILLSGSTTYVNSDTITIAVTAGGAMTAQRTVGTNGTHDIVIMAIFM